ncbi:MAG: enoyl-CoA hydratase/isomerase family protein [Sphingomonadales bacterium]|nr:enoyl-CoA hydratase/isomerase family protein [Sphingomonadales bacterium]
MSDILETRDGKIVTLTLNRPQALNALSMDMYRGLIAAFERLGTEQDVGAIVLRGEGRAFCVGGDVKGWAERGDWTQERQREELRWKQRLPLAMKSCPKAIVAALHGHVLGAGFSIALAADFRIADAASTFGSSFAGVGLPGDLGATHALVQLLGSAKARELMMLNERFDAAEALRLGLVTAVADDAEADARALAERLASGPYQAWGYMKRNLLAAESESLATVLELEAASHAACTMTEDHREAIAAFSEKRAPVWRGR